MEHAVLGAMYSFIVFCTTLSDSPCQDNPIQNLPNATGDEILSVLRHRIAQPISTNLHSMSHGRNI